MHGDSYCHKDMSAVGGDTVNNSLGAAIQHSLKSNQGRRGDYVIPTFVRGTRRVAYRSRDYIEFVRIGSKYAY